MKLTLTFNYKIYSNQAPDIPVCYIPSEAFIGLPMKVQVLEVCGYHIPAVHPTDLAR